MGWLDSLLGKKAEAAGQAADSAAFADSESTALASEESAQARELINRAAHEVLHLHGVPKDWVKFEILTLSDAAKAYFQLQVTMLHWDAYLLIHSRAFERAVQARIRERNTAVAQALRAVLWRIGAESDCPYESMPPSVAWTAEAIAQRQNNLDLFKVRKSPQVVPADWQQQQSGDFQPTLQVAHNQQEAEEALQQILQARQRQGGSSRL